VTWLVLLPSMLGAARGPGGAVGALLWDGESDLPPLRGWLAEEEWERFVSLPFLQPGGSRHGSLLP